MTFSLLLAHYTSEAMLQLHLLLVVGHGKITDSLLSTSRKQTVHSDFNAPTTHAMGDLAQRDAGV